MSKDKHEEKYAGKDTRDFFKKIDKKLSKIRRQQDEIVERLERLEKREGAPASRPVVSHDALVAFLDQFRAGEALGEASLGAWIQVSDRACVKGGLRTIQQREGMHARLLEARLKELGATPSFEIPEAVYQETMRGAGDSEKGDAGKIADFVKQFPDVDAAIQPILDMAARLDHDPETQFMLQTIAQDERATLEFVHEACALLNGGGDD